MLRSNKSALVSFVFIREKERGRKVKKSGVFTSCYQLAAVDILGPDMDPCTYPYNKIFCIICFSIETNTISEANNHFNSIVTCAIMLVVMVDLEI